MVYDIANYPSDELARKIEYWQKVALRYADKNRSGAGVKAVLRDLLKEQERRKQSR